MTQIAGWLENDFQTTDRMHTNLMRLQFYSQRKPTMKDDFLEFMHGTLDNYYAEMASLLEEGREAWCLPLLGPCY